nr:CRISPR-associated protein Csx3 [Caldilineaceae bacterium]
HYLDYGELDSLQAPVPAGTGGVVLSGRPPFWLLTGLAIAYFRMVPWLAVFYPPLNRAIVVFSRDPAYQLGQTVQART